MSRWRGIGQVACLGSLLAGMAFGDGGPPPWWWAHQEVVAPVDAAAYERATKEFFADVGTTQDLRVHVLEGADGVYTFLSTLMSGSEPETGRSILDRIRQARTRRLAARDLLEGDDHAGWLLVADPELSYVPDDTPWPEGETAFLSLSVLHLAPGKEKAATKALKRLAALHARHAPAAPLAVYRLRPEPPPVLVLVEAGASREALSEHRRNLEQRLAARGRGPRRQLQASVERREVVEGVLRGDLSYPPPAKVVPLEPLPPLRAEVAEPLAPLPPAPPPVAAPPPAEATAPQEEAPDFSAVEATVDAWATAWSEQRVDDYLGFYASSFETDAGSRQDWERQRRRRLTAPAYIEVTIEEPSVSVVGPRSARVEFTQTYESDVYSDVVRKRLELEWEAGAWKIAREEVVGTGPEASAPTATSRADGGDRYIVVATLTDEQAALRMSADLRAEGYPSEVFSNSQGTLVVTLDRLPYAEARRRRDEAVKAGHVPADAYLVLGTSFTRKISP